MSGALCGALRLVAAAVLLYPGHTRTVSPKYLSSRKSTLSAHAGRARRAWHARRQRLRSRQLRGRAVSRPSAASSDMVRSTTRQQVTQADADFLAALCSSRKSSGSSRDFLSRHHCTTLSMAKVSASVAAVMRLISSYSLSGSPSMDRRLTNSRDQCAQSLAMASAGAETMYMRAGLVDLELGVDVFGEVEHLVPGNANVVERQRADLETLQAHELLLGPDAEAGTRGCRGRSTRHARRRHRSTVAETTRKSAAGPFPMQISSHRGSRRRSRRR